MRPTILLASFCLLFLLGCHKTEVTPAKLDPGKLLTGEEVQSVVGEPLKEAIPSSRVETGFVISQSYFSVSTPSKSVVVTVTRRAEGKEGQEPREFWNEKFHGQGGEKEEKDREEEAERPRAAPKEIEGVGEEAFWLESGQSGALYALQGNSFIRVAVGGSDDEATKISKSTKLAKLVLARLR